MADKVKHLSVRLSEAENRALEYYCQQTSQSKTEVIREFIRSLVYRHSNPSSPKST
ncbi:CopG family transcriptional regulator [Gloeomargarita sp.]|mgnify:CR=1 FL=1